MPHTPPSQDDPYFRAVVEASSDLIVVLDALGHVEYVNPAAERILQYRPEEVLGTALMSYVHPEDQAAAERALREEYGGKNEFPVLDVRARAKDGSWVPLECKAWLQQHVTPPRLAMIARDLRVRSRADRVLTEREAWARAVLEASPVAIVTLDEQLRVLEWNTTAERIYGWTAAEARGRLHPGLQPVGEDVAMLRELLGAAQPALDQFASRRRRDGSVFEVSVAVSPLRRLDGTVAGLVELSTDVSAQRAVARRFERSQRLEAASRMAGGVARDLERLLGALDSGVRALQGADPKAAEAGLRELRAELESARALTVQLRELGAAPQRGSLESLVDEVLGQLVAAARLEAPQLVVHADLGVPELRVRVGAERLRDLVMPLLQNAQEAVGGNGRVTLRSSSVALGELEAVRVGVGAGSYARIEVTDAGPELPALVIERAFEPFFTTKDAATHRGLGLSRVQAAVRKLGGAVTLERGLSRGAVATLYLPVAAPAAAGADVEAPSVTGVPTRLRALVLDENPVTREQMQRVLTGEGYRVHVAATLDALLSLADHVEAVLLVTPLVLAGATGRELAQRLRSLHPDLRVLYTTASQGSGIGALSAREAILTLPFTDGDLRTAVQLLRALG